MLKSTTKQLSVSIFSLAALVLPGVAQATTILDTSPLFANNGQSYHACNVANVSSSPVALKVDMLDSSGVVIATSGAANITLAAGHSTEISHSSTYSGFARCRFTFSVPPGDIRANLSVFHWTGAFYYTLAMSEAR